MHFDWIIFFLSSNSHFATHALQKKKFVSNVVIMRKQIPIILVQCQPLLTLSVVCIQRIQCTHNTTLLTLLTLTNLPGNISRLLVYKIKMGIGTRVAASIASILSFSLIKRVLMNSKPCFNNKFSFNKYSIEL